MKARGPGADEQTSDVAGDALFDVTAHARLAARLVASPGEAMEDLRVLGLQSFEARAQANLAINARLAHDQAALRAWHDAFERELALHG